MVFTVCWLQKYKQNHKPPLHRCRQLCHILQGAFLFKGPFSRLSIRASSSAFGLTKTLAGQNRPALRRLENDRHFFKLHLVNLIILRNFANRNKQ